VLHLQASGAGHFGRGAAVTILLMLAGPAAVVPLALFAWSARRLPLSAVGFLQFIAPTLQFLVGLAFGEPFTPMRACRSRSSGSASGCSPSARGGRPACWRRSSALAPSKNGTRRPAST
jgi:chloramphenicol-sensitive protein RarD